MRIRLLALAAIVFFAALSAKAEAAPFLDIVFGTPVGLGGCLNSSASDTSGPLSHSQACSNSVNSSSFVASATADFGSVGGDLQGTAQNSLGHGGNLRTEFVGDYVFAGPATSVTVRVNFDADGQLRTECTGNCAASAQVRGTGGLVNALNVIWNATDGEDLEISEDLLSGPIVVPVGRPVALGVSLRLFAGFGSPGTIHDVFGSTVTFNTDGPVFTLPEGFSVNGPCVENNRFVCGDVTEPPTGVPQPAAWALMLIGAAGALLRSAGRRAG